MAELLNETKIDQSKVYFHGSSEARVNQLKAPSTRHPFYVTPDLHYAMAFCTKDDSQTGDYEDEDKIYTPASQNFVYCVSLKPTCKAFDFRDHNSTEFKKLYKVIDQELVEWVVKRNSRSFDMSDIFEFVAALQGSVVKLVDMSRANYFEYTKLFGDEPELMSPKLFSKACAFCKNNGLYETWADFSIHQTMAPILEGLQKQGFHAILTRETDFNDEDPTKPSAKVSTSYALGIFDKAGIDLVSLVPLRYNWLKRINPTYLQDKTEASAGEKIERFIKLYKKITEPKNIDESQLEAEEQWYFGNNRSKNLKVVKPSWDAPFFLTTSYEYADDYSDYGVYKIELVDRRDLNILDFNNEEEVQKLGWPEVLVDKIIEGRSDLNSLAYDLYLLTNGSTDSLMYIEDTDEWLDTAIWFQDRSEDIFKLVRSKDIWGSEKDHQFLLQMWKDIYDAGFAGFTYQEFRHKILAFFDLKCIEKISIKPVKAVVNERLKSRALKKAFNAKGQDAFPKIKSDDDIVFVNGIPKDKALQLLKRACHDVSNFHPEYMEKAIKWSDDYIFGVFNKHDRRNVLAMAAVSYNGDESGAAYLHEMSGFIKGGYGKKLVMWLLQKFKKVYGQIALEGSGTKDDPYRPNEKLRDKFYATIPGIKIYRVENSIWNCPADFFYYGMSDESIKEFLEKTYGSKDSLNENCMQYDPPYTLEQIKVRYPEHIYNMLASDPVHKWRADSGIELIHKEPTEEELDRIWKNWQLMPQDMKDISDKKSVEMFGCTNAEHYNKLKASENHLDEKQSKLKNKRNNHKQDLIMNQLQQIHYWAHMLDEAFGRTYSIKTYPEYIEKEILNNKYHPYEFNDKYGEWSDADAGFITPYGTIIHCGGSNHHDAFITVLGDDVKAYAQQLAKICKSRSLDDIIDNSDDSALIADALDHGLIRFDAEDNFVQFGKTITSKSLDLLYDFVDYVMQQQSQIKDDVDGHFRFDVTFGEGIGSNGDIVYSKNTITYSSLDEFSKRFINDVKANVNIING